MSPRECDNVSSEGTHCLGSLLRGHGRICTRHATHPAAMLLENEVIEGEAFELMVQEDAKERAAYA
jgi:hypothetical protein